MITAECKKELEKIIKIPKGSRAKFPKLPNGYGSISILSGKRRKPYLARAPVTQWIDGKAVSPECIGTYEDWWEAFSALDTYKKTKDAAKPENIPIGVHNTKITFEEVFYKLYDRKFKVPYDHKGKKTSTEYAYRAAFQKCKVLHNRPMWEITADDLRDIIDNPDYSHSIAEHIKVLYNRVYKFADELNAISKDYSKFVEITQEEDDEHGVPFTADEMKLFWQHKDIPFVDVILIYCYSGWRLNELSLMPKNDIDLINMTFFGGNKTPSSKERIVPIHSKIQDLVVKRYSTEFSSLIFHDFETSMCESVFREKFFEALLACGIKEKHTPHDCRHTFNSMLDSAGVNEVCKLRLMGHAGKNINQKIYTHKSIEELRAAVESI